MEEELKQNIPHIVILVILIVGGLFVLTKFSWIRCEDVPGWCSVYCKLVGNSRIAMISGKTGVGNPEEFSRQIMQYTYHVVENIPPSQLSFGVLQRYDLVIVERVENLTEKQIEAIQGYMDMGGTILWVGDSGIKGIRGLPEELINENKNNTNQSTVSAELQQNQWQKTGLNNYLLADYDKTIDARNATLITIMENHPIMLGLKKELTIRRTEFTIVKENPAGVTKISNMLINGEEYVGIMENRYVGRIIYFAFPPENVGSETFIMNLIGYLVNC